ncbi:DedA family protein [Paenibacillus sp. IB182496]|uniref:DedA family protein n=1 Tax=Paenibacillus sabuli TaxID=2772509 RepID=A0A927BVX3_9BACL|nr:VTT domain-containing protein [Paenibacillus sabuli]MBD2846725.1 DedA family protein [Paenibacillus sabuli]
MLYELIEWLKEFGALGLFIHSFLDAIIFPIPAFFLQVSLSLLDPSSALWLATVGYIACLLGTPIGYLIGKLLGNALLYKLLKKEWIDRATAMFQKNGETAILVGSFTPIPFKVFTIMSGCMNFPLWRLLGYAALGRAVKFYVVGAMFYFYGRAAEGMVKDVSLYIFIGSLPLIGLYLWLRRRRRLKREALRQSKLAQAEDGDSQTEQAPDLESAQPGLVLEQQPRVTRHGMHASQEKSVPPEQ